MAKGLSRMRGNSHVRFLGGWKVVTSSGYPVAEPQRCYDFQCQELGATFFGFDHGVGHSLLLLYDAKTPRGQKIKEFKGLGRDPSNTSISLFQIITKYFICISV